MTTAQDRLNQFVTQQATDTLLGALATLEDTADPDAPTTTVQLLAVQNEIEARFTPAQNDYYDAMLGNRWNEIAEWTQARVYTEVLTNA